MISSIIIALNLEVLSCHTFVIISTKDLTKESKLQCKNELEKIKKLKTILNFATKPHEQNIIKSN